MNIYINSRYIDKAILENIDIEILKNIDIDKDISENINIDKISNQLEFGILNRATRRTCRSAPMFLECTNLKLFIYKCFIIIIFTFFLLVVIATAGRYFLIQLKATAKGIGAAIVIINVFYWYFNSYFVFLLVVIASFWFN